MRLPFRLAWNSTASYVGLLAGSFALALVVSYVFGPQVNDYAYDSMFRAYRPPKPAHPESVVLAIDELTLMDCGGIRGIRTPIARALQILAPANPKAVAIDIILADRNPAEDPALAAALHATRNLVLSTELIDDGAIWEDPRPEFAAGARLGHVSTAMDRDGLTRSILIDQHNARVQRRALALEAFLLSRGVDVPREDLEFTQLRGGLSRTTFHVGSTDIPILVNSRDRRRLMRVRFYPPDLTVPRVSVKRLLDNPALASEFTGKVVFVGVTANSEIHDRLFTPFGMTPGTEINAAAFETMAQGSFLTDVGTLWENLVALFFLVAIGLAFRYLPGWWAYGAGAVILVCAMLTPYFFFINRHVFPFATSFFSAWMGTLTAASYYHLVVRRNLRIEQTSRERYQQAMHFVTHEMRTPLSAIQGSSELISRYPLTEDKRKQIALLINSESKRLARMVEIFLNVERLSAGQMELKQEAIPVKQMMEVCVDRVRPLGERKHIEITLEPIPESFHVTGDRELLEYACYNLLTNAVKYSSQRTEVTASARKSDNWIQIAVQDQGIGMDQKEVKQIFQKFYRTKRAEESGEVGTGIGLSIVQQIVEQHGGRIEVTSRPGAGSCFTVVMAARAADQIPAAPERN
ncbi:MAG: CHASE2 domain-containing protein [Candidatus Solibacter sp.]